MFFRNLTMFRFPTTLDLAALDERLREMPLKPVGPQELMSAGFIEPYGADPMSTITEGLPDQVLLSIGTETRLLPASVVDKALRERLAVIEREQGRKPGGRARKQMKEDIVHEMLPRAFVKPGRIDAYLDLYLGVVFVDTSSRAAAESVVSHIRHAMGSFPAIPLNAEVAPRSVLTGWIAGEALPDGLSLGDEFELRDADDNGGVVKCQRMDVATEEVQSHLEAGKQVSKLGLVFNDHVSFVLGEDLVIRKLKFLDGALDDTLESSGDSDDLRAELDARFAVMTGTVGRLFATLQGALKLSQA